MKKWKLFKRLGMSKPRAKIAAYLVDNEGINVPESDLVGISLLLPKEVSKIVADLNYYTVQLRGEDQECRLGLLDVERYENSDVGPFYRVKRAFFPCYSVSGPADKQGANE